MDNHLFNKKKQKHQRYKSIDKNSLVKEADQQDAKTSDILVVEDRSSETQFIPASSVKNFNKE